MKTLLKVLIYCHDIKVYQDSGHRTPSVLKGNSRFEILLAKIFILKQKNKSNTSSNYRKELNFVSLGNQPSDPLEVRLELGNVRQNPFREI